MQYLKPKPIAADNVRYGRIPVFAMSVKTVTLRRSAACTFALITWDSPIELAIWDSYAE